MIYIITGHYGSGKSTVSANLAAQIKKGAPSGTVCVVDMDTVNPYYRTADLRQFFEENGVELISPMYARTNLDIPILDFDLAALSERFDNIIADMGGDDAGAYPLGRYNTFLAQNEHELLYVVNFRRLLTQSPEDALDSMREIESAVRLPVTGFINNTNLGPLTDESVIAEGIKKSELLGQMGNIPLRYTTCPETVTFSTEIPLQKIQILIKNSWDA